MCEPLSVGIYACQRANISPGHLVAIFGAGPIGLVSFLAAKAFGASKCLITGLNKIIFLCSKKQKFVNFCGFLFLVKILMIHV